jgi:DNA repair exonuclease SbcCD ATPase subunit
LSHVEFAFPICKIDDYECLQGEGELGKQLKSLINEIKNGRKEIRKIGIILDIDKNSLRQRIKFVNSQLKQLKRLLGQQYHIIEAGQFIPLTVPTDDEDDEEIIIELACYFMNVEGIGELETVLKAIKAKESLYADCLQNWRDCLKSHNQEISEKFFDKHWLHYYIRYDTCSDEEQRLAGDYCDIRKLDYVFKNKPDIFNFDHEVLNELKAFLRMFN